MENISNNKVIVSGPTYPSKMLILGAPDVGKKTLVNSLLSEGSGDVSNDWGGKADFDVAKLDLYLLDSERTPSATVHFEISSSSSKANHSNSLKTCYSEAQCVLFVFDITSM